MVLLRYVYRSRARSSSSPEWSATAIPLSTPQLDFHQRDLYSTFRTPFTLLSTLHAFMVGYCLLKFNLGGFVSRWLLQSCFRSRISRNIIFEKYRFPLHSRFSRDEKLYSFFFVVVERDSILEIEDVVRIPSPVFTIWNGGKIIKVYNYFRNHWIGICSKLLRCN